MQLRKRVAELQGFTSAVPCSGSQQTSQAVAKPEGAPAAASAGENTCLFPVKNIYMPFLFLLDR